jgi:hypothetical protein
MAFDLVRRVWNSSIILLTRLVWLEGLMTCHSGRFRLPFHPICLSSLSQQPAEANQPGPLSMLSSKTNLNGQPNIIYRFPRTIAQNRPFSPYLALFSRIRTLVLKLNSAINSG